ncbi:DNA polymerase III subunit delta' [Falsiroseomonas tokyonensis]|uniref:DNA polymerase III subunit delta n=1 Tax=Falsiroseomonas tokyonensis TaxID=430521 RepID=A0ABV7BVQ1_9PROT|nr:DNA polymerase III subunit delta' [Falsiroseomonas tokyonensis]MBU8538247.1 DNA polymerase III subunit delta' [Falsiroseomonas tokyonensis]
MSRAPRAPKEQVFAEDPDQAVRAMPDLFGHVAAAETLQRAALSGRLPHAWMLAGPPGIGKATLGYRFGRWLLAGGAEGSVPLGSTPLNLDPQHTTFRRIAAGAHADLRALRPNTGEKGGVKLVIRVEDVRDAIRFLAMTPAEGGWRFVLVDGAEMLRPEAANALLKTLEEPPPRAVLVLTTAAPDRLLPTIRSRVRRLDLSPLDAAVLDPLLGRLLPELNATERATLGRIAEGSAGQAVALAEGEGLALQALVDQALGELGDRRNWHRIADAVAAKRDGSGFATFIALLRRAISSAVRQAARGQGAPGWLGERPLAEWSTLWDSLGRLAAETDVLSLDRKQAVLTALLWLSPSRR